MLLISGPITSAQGRFLNQALTVVDPSAAAVRTAANYRHVVIETLVRQIHIAFIQLKVQSPNSADQADYTDRAYGDVKIYFKMIRQ